jgi:SAM-dependent methyltransferase
MVEIACRETCMSVMNSTFQELNFKDIFDGVWAQASLLHISYDVTREIYQKIHRSLKTNGIFYASYKYCDRCMTITERDFYNMNENKVLPYLDGLFNVIDIYHTKENRNKVASSPNGMWFNFIVCKI